MEQITDEFMHRMLPAARPYTIVILKAGPRRNQPDADAILWEHGRRNFALRANGVLSIVCPVTDKSGIAGIGIFNTAVPEVEKIMENDPAVHAGILVCEVHPCRSFPGDCLPEEHWQERQEREPTISD